MATEIMSVRQAVRRDIFPLGVIGNVHDWVIVHDGRLQLDASGLAVRYPSEGKAAEALASVR